VPGGERAVCSDLVAIQRCAPARQRLEQLFSRNDVVDRLQQRRKIGSLVISLSSRSMIFAGAVMGTSLAPASSGFSVL
jgi:hypothetical protein